ncbi:D-aminoacyl-tRNA deacylase [Penicillium subrubescens]|uniref:D-aminoacyl-tRNA deacylase n=1 Tax=Penicillium subrubescens TaxID=1316194 RepID=UPI002544DAB9|nr:D-aminoacyl-tRNA deacylase [Penicillium subrubescens]KAJ5886561.1 D-aminoacyl-tRNA deacylase [Penicillium subrubescens]
MGVKVVFLRGVALRKKAQIGGKTVEWSSRRPVEWKASMMPDEEGGQHLTRRSKVAAQTRELRQLRVFLDSAWCSDKWLFVPVLLKVRRRTPSEAEETMKIVIQRVKSASVTVDSELISSIGKGLLVFAGVGKDDTEKEAENLVNKVLKAKFWPDENGAQWKKNVQDIEGEVLCVSQFTLYGKMKKGNKPDFHDAADPTTARKLYDHFYNKMRENYVPDRVKNGVFQAMMDVELKNDGPVGVDYRSEDAAVTIEIDTNLPKKEPKEPKDQKKEKGDKGKGKDNEDDSETRHVFEFKLPAELLA